MAQVTKENAKDIVQAKWTEHRKLFQAFAVNPPNEKGRGFMTLDMTSRPIVFNAFAFDGELRTMTGFIPDDMKDGEPQALFAAIMNGVIDSTALNFNDTIRALGLTGDAVPDIANISVRVFGDNLRDPKLSARLPRDGLVASETKRFEASGLNEFRALFNRDAINALSCADTVKLRDYTFYSVPGELGDIRRQAAKYFPLLASFIVERFSVRRAVDAQLAEKERTTKFLASDEYAAKLASKEVRNGVERTVLEWMKQDGREPYPAWIMSEKAIRVAIQKACGDNPDGQPVIPMHVLNNLRGVSWPTHGVPIERILFSLAELPPDWFPKNREEWDAFCDLSDTVTKVLGKLSGVVTDSGRYETIPLKTLYEGCGGKWVAYRERFIRTYADSRPPEGVTEEDYAIIEKSTDWKGLATIPSDKLMAVAIETVERMTGLSERCPKEELSKWIYRRVRPDLSRAALNNACFEVEEMLDAFARKILMPLAANEAMRTTGRQNFNIAEQHNIIARMAAARILIGAKSATRMMELVRAYINRTAEIDGAGQNEDTKEDLEKHARNMAIMSAVGVVEDDGPDCWAPLCQVIRAPNDVFIVPLTSPKMLKDEGRSRSGSSLNQDGSHGLRICVSEPNMPYIKNCQLHGEHIVSFRKVGGNDGVPYTRLSCLQIGPISLAEPGIKILQHRGQSNGSVPAEVNLALDWFQNEIRNGNIALNYEGVRSRLELFRSKRIDEIFVMCTYDWKKRSIIAEAMQPWSSFVGKRFRKMSIDEFARDPDVGAVINALAPTLKSITEAAPHP